MSDFIPGFNLILKQNDAHFKMTSDSVHLANFMTVRKHDRVLDVGCNTGVLSLVAATMTDRSVIGIDINAQAVALAQENAIINKLTNLSFQAIRFQDFKDGVFDLVVCNPPYYEKTRTQSLREGQARFDTELTLEDLAIHAFLVLKDKGRLVIIIPTERFTEWMTLAQAQHLSVKRVAFIHHDRSKAAHTVLVEAVKNGKGILKVEAPIFNRNT